MLTTFLRRSNRELRRRWSRLALGVAATLVAALPVSTRAQTAGRITGTVVNEAGQPVPSAQVSIPSTTFGALTNEQGKYTITGSAYGISSKNPNTTVTTEFKIVADC